MFGKSPQSLNEIYVNVYLSTDVTKPISAGYMKTKPCTGELLSLRLANNGDEAPRVYVYVVDNIAHVLDLNQNHHELCVYVTQRDRQD